MSETKTTRGRKPLRLRISIDVDGFVPNDYDARVEHKSLLLEPDEVARTLKGYGAAWKNEVVSVTPVTGAPGIMRVVIEVPGNQKDVRWWNNEFYSGKDSDLNLYAYVTNREMVK